LVSINIALNCHKRKAIRLLIINITFGFQAGGTGVDLKINRDAPLNPDTDVCFEK
jgi:hypothetical protein